MSVMIRLLAALLCITSLSSLAAAPRGPKAIGSAKEDEPCPAPKGPDPADVAFLRAVQWAFEPAPPEVRGQAIEDLGLLGDARALNLLAPLTLDSNALLARAAVRAVASIRHPRAEEILANIVRHPNAATPTKQYALSLIPYQNTPTALRFVHFIARQPTGAYELLTQARALSSQLPVPTPESALPLPTAPAPSPIGDTK